MAAHGQAPHITTAPLSQGSLLDRHHFLFRRLHSLTGIVPVGVFVIFHLFTNFQIVAGDFQHEVAFIHGLPALLAIEVVLWLSIAFHATLGIYYTAVGTAPNVHHYPYGANRRYALQRITGILALIFIFLHIATLRWRWSLGPWHTPFMLNGATPDQPLAAATTAVALQTHWMVVVLYLIGGMAVVYHWANGLWTAAITWGLTLTPAAQKRWGYFCLAMGAVLSVFLLGAVWGAVNYDVPEAQRALIQLKIDYEAGLVPENEYMPRAEALWDQMPHQASAH